MTRRMTLVVALVAFLVAGAVPANAAIRIAKIAFDPPGADTGTNRSLNQEIIVIKNTGSSGRSLRGWKIVDSGGEHRFTFFRFTLRAGARVRIHTGTGPDSRSDLYWDLNDYAWNNSGDTARLKTAGGRLVDRCRYGAAASSPKRC